MAMKGMPRQILAKMTLHCARKGSPSQLMYCP